MKAPDKVFFPNDINLLTKLSLVIKQKGDVCYIRKNALLEWAKEKAEDYKGTANIRRSFEMMIRKIESL